MTNDLYESKEFLHRLNECRRKNNMTREDVANHFGLHKTGVGKWFSKRCPPKRLPELARLFGVEIDYLLSGQKLKGIRESTDELTDRDVHVTVYDVSLSAGGGTYMPEYIETKNTVVFDSNWLITNGLKTKNIFMMKVKGDSMLGTLNDGDTVMIDKSQNQIVDGKIYAVIIGGDAKIKQLKRRFDMSIEVISTNKEYQTEVIPPEETNHIYIIGRVVWSAGLM